MGKRTLLSVYFTDAEIPRWTSVVPGGRPWQTCRTEVVLGGPGGDSFTQLELGGPGGRSAVTDRIDIPDKSGTGYFLAEFSS